MSPAEPDDDGSVPARLTHSTGTGCRRRATRATGPAVSSTQSTAPRGRGGLKRWKVPPATAAPVSCTASNTSGSARSRRKLSVRGHDGARDTHLARAASGSLISVQA